MRYLALLVTLTLAGLVGRPAPPDEAYFAADGTVVAVQGDKGDARINDPRSMGDMVEVWMLRIDKWPRPGKPNFILVEYKHRDAVVKDSELDRTVWRFDIRPTLPTQAGTCMSWWTQDFTPTALGVNQKLPPAKELECFLMRNRPVALRTAKVQK